MVLEKEGFYEGYQAVSSIHTDHPVGLSFDSKIYTFGPKFVDLSV